MIEITIVRHADKGKERFKHVLSLQGIADARAFGETLCGCEFDYLAVTEWFRTAQTLVAIAEGAGDFVAHRIDVVPLITTDEKSPEYTELLALVGRAGGKQSLPAILEADVVLTQVYAARFSHRLARYIESLPSESRPNPTRVLLVAHAPIIEMAVWNLTGCILEALPPLGRVTLAYKSFPRQLAARNARSKKTC